MPEGYKFEPAKPKEKASDHMVETVKAALTDPIGKLNTMEPEADNSSSDSDDSEDYFKMLEKKT